MDSNELEWTRQDVTQPDVADELESTRMDSNELEWTRMNSTDHATASMTGQKNVAHSTDHAVTEDKPY